ncbi:thiamine phosphate synthase [Zobellia galactanivorans]|uniref:Thiamine-phosphate synthase n=1 Tax=Zobellia galactanivorans (strain DSM 12802 / CCUG 47099 / CIP 106680 / NCIMB 13871 / Dsij) TaxID=63186 RepID=G0L8R9_ZOBGA|nr:thiamine phosphate synthase [Zobellia galactanivorans]CAZ97794.1 Thiamine-phosphate pyrophosphorylase [Zobellia galactanivorans]
MNIPKLHYISQGKTPEEHLENIQKACTSGAELVQLRLKNVKKSVVLKTAEKARELTAHFQTRLIINDHYQIAKEVQADGVHLGKTDADPVVARKLLGDYYIIGGTANTLDDCLALVKKGVNYIGLGPFRFTTTKENLSPIIPLIGYQGIVGELNSDMPIIAIGGITIDDVPEILKTGVYGIAASGEITKDFNKINAFHKLLKAPSTNEQIWNRETKF